jgi:hypothetical protein
MHKSCFHRAVPKSAQESRQEPTKAEESRSEPSQQKGGMFILRCSATVDYTRYAISTTIERTFSGGCTIEATSWLYKRSGQQSLMSQFLEVGSTSVVSIGDRHGKCEDVRCVMKS